MTPAHHHKHKAPYSGALCCLSLSFPAGVTSSSHIEVGHQQVPTMKSTPTYLSRNRHGTFYFRMVIPAFLRHRVNGKREIRRSLKTDSERLALKRARQHAARFDSIFDRASRMIEHNDYEPSPEDFDIFEELCGSPKSNGAGAWSSPDHTPKKTEPALSNAEIEERQRRHCIAELLTGRHNRPIPSELEPLALQLLELTRSYKPTELPSELPKFREQLATSRLRQEADSATARSPARVEAPAFDPKMANWTLYQVWQHQLERDKADTSSTGGQANRSGSLEENERFARVMTVLTEHKPVCQLTKWDWQKAYDAARRMKAGAEASLTPPTPLSELLTDNLEQMTGHDRTNTFITTMKGIQEHALFLELTTISPDSLLIKQVQKRESERTRKGKAFSAKDVEAIFSGYIYQGPVPSNRTKAYPFWFWLPLVAYFTGARTNEIAQLDTADIREIDGHPCFDFCPDDPNAFEAKRVKTEEARQVPVHPRLIELGFLEYVGSQRQAKQKKLFGDGLSYLPPRDEDTNHNKEGWAKSASKFFNEKPKGYLVEIGVHVPNDGKSIYSFRHTLETNLRNIRRSGTPVAQYLIDAITGHAPEEPISLPAIDKTTVDAITGHLPSDIAGKNYDDGATIQHKLAALKLLPIPEAIKQLTSYRVDFVERFEETLNKSINSHRRKHPRPI